MGAGQPPHILHPLPPIPPPSCPRYDRTVPYTSIRPPDGHICATPALTSGRVIPGAGLGSRWTCGRCGARWTLEAHETISRSAQWAPDKGQK